jgi:hypothetical protein
MLELLQYFILSKDVFVLCCFNPCLFPLFLARFLVSLCFPDDDDTDPSQRVARFRRVHLLLFSRKKAYPNTLILVLVHMDDMTCKCKILKVA